MRCYDSSVWIFSETLALTYPQLPHARWGNRAVPHFGQATMFFGLSA